jgi:hypothetical protein
MENVSYCPYRTSVNWANVQITQFTAPVTFLGEVQVTQLEPAVTFTGTPSDVELIESCKENQDPTKGIFSDINDLYRADSCIVPAGGLAKYLVADQFEEEDTTTDNKEAAVEGDEREVKLEETPPSPDDGGGEEGNNEECSGNEAGEEPKVESEEPQPSGESEAISIPPVAIEAPVEPEVAEPQTESKDDNAQLSTDELASEAPGDDAKPSEPTPIEAPKVELGKCSSIHSFSHVGYHFERILT